MNPSLSQSLSDSPSPARLQDDPVICLSDLHLSMQSASGATDILKGIDLAVPAGQSVAILGPSGAGKTSLLMVMAGLEAASSGTVELAGSDITRLDEDALARIRRDCVGIVFQAFRLIPSMTALQNVSVPLELAHDPQAADKAADRKSVV